MMLSAHFSLEELTASEVAARADIDNTPSAEVLRNLKRLAEGLELVRVALGNKPVHVTSGYRSARLNQMVGGCRRIPCTSKVWRRISSAPHSVRRWKFAVRSPDRASGRIKSFTSSAPGAMWRFHAQARSGETNCSPSGASRLAQNRDCEMYDSRIGPAKNPAIIRSRHARRQNQEGPSG